MGNSINVGFASRVFIKQARIIVKVFYVDIVAS